MVIWIVKIIKIGKRSADEMDAGGGYWIMAENLQIN
jgi:hypothetical protein